MSDVKVIQFLKANYGEWVETPGWVDYLLLTRIRGYVKVFERGEL